MKMPFKLTTILIFSTCLFLVACSNSEEKTTTQPMTTGLREDSLKLEKARLELEAQKIQLQKERLQTIEQTQTQRADNALQVELAKKANEFRSNGQGVVTVDKAYFYDRADLNTRRTNVFLIRGDQFYASNVTRDFVYVTFYNENNGKTTTGYLYLDDVENVSW